MKKPQKIGVFLGVLIAPVIVSVLTMTVPNIGLVMMFLLGLPGSSSFAIQFALILAVAAAFGLVGGQSDPFRPFALALL